MRRLLLSSSIALASLGLLSSPVHAQATTPSSGAAPTSPSAPAGSGSASTAGAPESGASDAEAAPTPATAPDEAAAEAEPAESPYDDEAEPSPAPSGASESPSLSPLDVGGRVGSGEEGEIDPAASADRLEQAAPPVEKRRWTLSETTLHLHGYMRLRGNFLRGGSLGHRPELDRGQYDSDQLMASDPESRGNFDPFPFFAADDSTRRSSADNANSAPVEGGCRDNPGADGRCSKRGQVSGDLRLRLKPEIHLSDDVRVKAWIDVLDNVGLGTMGYGPRPDLSADSAIRARRVWGEARNRDIGELRFGRMGADWGLGIVDNGGDRYGIDSDFSTEVDRIMGMTNLAGFYLMAAYDWASEGYVRRGSATPSGLPIDMAQKDDLDAVTVAVARKLDEDVQKSAVARGETVFNYGLYFIWRKQLLQPNWDVLDRNPSDGNRYRRTNFKQYIPDLWAQLLWEGLRIELEVAYAAGGFDGACPSFERTVGATGANPNAGGDEADLPEASMLTGRCKFRQLGAALELEYRMFDERLGVFLNAGFASGDSDAYGLAATNSPTFQRSSGGQADRTVSTFAFHPDYRIDLILWRTIMRRVAGAYYVKPGIGYDFIRDPYGQLAGGRVDLIYSRAATPNQTWGQDANLGLELDLSLYYRSEDGPDVLDGFYGLVQFGVLFPMNGLGYAFENAPDTKNALILRGVAGIAF